MADPVMKIVLAFVAKMVKAIRILDEIFRYSATKTNAVRRIIPTVPMVAMTTHQKVLDKGGPLIISLVLSSSRLPSVNVPPIAYSAVNKALLFISIESPMGILSFITK